MSTLVGSAAIACAGAGVLVLMLGVGVRQPLDGLRVCIDLWLAASLLRLSTAASWSTLAVTATVVITRKLVTLRPPRR